MEHCLDQHLQAGMLLRMQAFPQCLGMKTFHCRTAAWARQPSVKSFRQLENQAECQEPAAPGQCPAFPGQTLSSPPTTRQLRVNRFPSMGQVESMVEAREHPEPIPPPPSLEAEAIPAETSWSEFHPTRLLPADAMPGCHFHSPDLSATPEKTRSRAFPAMPGPAEVWRRKGTAAPLRRVPRPISERWIWASTPHCSYRYLYSWYLSTWTFSRTPRASSVRTTTEQ